MLTKWSVPWKMHLYSSSLLSLQWLTGQKKKRGGGYDLFKWDGSKSPLVIDSAFVIKQHTYPWWQLETWKRLTLEQQTQTIKPTKHIDP